MNNDFNSNDASPRDERLGDQAVDPREQLDLLVSRIADGEAGESDWAAFNALAERSPEAWKVLAQAQRDHGAMSLAVGVALHAADRVELPSRDAAGRFGPQRDGDEVPQIRVLARLGAWSGWAAAAVVAVMAWSGASWLSPVGMSRMTGMVGSGGAGGPTSGASVVPAGWTLNTPDDAVRAYLDLGGRAGNVVGELPSRVVVNTQPMVLDDGQQAVRVVYIRQFVEQAVVTDLMRMATDEAGRAVPVPVSPFVPMSGPQ